MKALRLIATLLDYPTQEVHGNLDLIENLVREDSSIPLLARESLTLFIHQAREKDLLDWQSEYDGLFERGRSVSLHLFEHVHGESRDRGQAMVELLRQYRDAGLELSVRELPDYLPVYLEFAATQGNQALGWVMDVAHVLTLLQARLEERESDYTLVMGALLRIADVEVDLAELRKQVAGEERDDTPEALDKIWEEEAVSFTAPDNNSCPSSRYRPSPAQRCDDVSTVQWVEAPISQPLNMTRS
ncbi:nitrate reductase molybdenum cofactor assembly chaperone [Hahella sp. CCB-MM4]|uniref:nitrate reductase molybdenum cofactor assembly chaperone n=1 Tax=Hahella sp. (strain CCB-MM4) TaxID=1926491 RepID=UPI000B9BE220|nr:nitrate reductase molybdenum cofactor assembly chaperone [Hahella sp. CCB-MM4]OZG72336.1 nitrate reductase molybdenum cofactor assembly chaperone [Hahella sp. CCB-MM4]